MQLKKLFHILFSFYFIALAFIPCGDEEACSALKQSETSEQSHKEDHSEEFCTPFCVCSCCSSPFLIKKDFYSSLQQIEITNTVYTVHEESKTSTPIISIWQPPKIS